MVFVFVIVSSKSDESRSTQIPDESLVDSPLPSPPPRDPTRMNRKLAKAQQENTRNTQDQRNSTKTTQNAFGIYDRVMNKKKL